MSAPVDVSSRGAALHWLEAAETRARVAGPVDEQNAAALLAIAHALVGIESQLNDVKNVLIRGEP